MVNPEFTVAIYYGLKILAATLVYCFYHPVLLTGPQRETIGTCVPLLLHPPDATKLPVARVVVCDMILFLNIIMIMPASQNRSNCALRCGLLHLATKSTAKSGLNVPYLIYRSLKRKAWKKNWRHRNQAGNLPASMCQQGWRGQIFSVSISQAGSWGV